MENLIWIGIRESEIKYTNFIKDSITVFGKDNLSIQREFGKNINHNKVSNNIIINNFYHKKMFEILRQNSNAKFMCYSQIYNYYEIKKWILLDKIVCLNNQELVQFIHNKFKIKEYLKNIVPVLDYQIIKGKYFDYKKISKELNAKKIVAQLANSSGGFGTILVDENTSFKLDKNEEYMVTKYCINNLSINVSALISENNIVLLPGSIQIIELFNNKLSYKGSDFISYRALVSKEMNHKARENAYKIATIMQKNGYRGLFGIDMIIYEDEVYLMEINPRFQNSNLIINKALSDNSLPSLQELQYKCFYEKAIYLKDFEVNYSTYINEYGQTARKFNANKIETLDFNSNIIEYEDMSYISTDVYNKAIVPDLFFEGHFHIQ